MTDKIFIVTAIVSAEDGEVLLEDVRYLDTNASPLFYSVKQIDKDDTAQIMTRTFIPAIPVDNRKEDTQ